MSARDDFGSSAGRGPGAGGLGNGGIGGGMGGGSRGGGAGYNAGAGSRTGLTTGTTTYGNTAFGRPGGNAVAYGMRDAASLNRAGMGPTVGSFGNFRTPSGAAMFGNSPVQGQSFYGQNMGQALSQANRAQARQPQVGGLLGGSPVAAGAPAYSAVEQEMSLPAYENPIEQPVMGWLPSWPGTGQWWGDQARYQNNAGLSRGAPGPTLTIDGYKTNYGDPLDRWNRSPDGNRYDGPGSTYAPSGNTVSQNGMGSIRSGLRGNGGR
tara:strand:+ start:496 stop:1290 length:795 start_codon:yes stop_codon:yes gene_type:complete